MPFDKPSQVANPVQETADHESDCDQNADLTVQTGKTFVTPISNPLVSGKLLTKALKLLKYAAVTSTPHGGGNKAAASSDASGSKSSNPKIGASARAFRRGVVEVTKAVRKEQRGIVFLAADVFPVDIISHLPVFCEEKNLLYCFLNSKRILGAACRSKRPSSVVMVMEPTKTAPTALQEAYNKFSSSLQKMHPYF